MVGDSRGLVGQSLGLFADSRFCKLYGAFPTMFSVLFNLMWLAANPAVITVHPLGSLGPLVGMTLMSRQLCSCCCFSSCCHCITWLMKM